MVEDLFKQFDPNFGRRRVGSGCYLYRSSPTVEMPCACCEGPMTFRNDDDKAFTNDPLAPSPDRFFNDGSYVTDENVRLVHRMCQFIERGSLGIKADNWDEPMTRKNVEMIIELYEATAETDLIQGINL